MTWNIPGWVPFVVVALLLLVLGAHVLLVRWCLRAKATSATAAALAAGFVAATWLAVALQWDQWWCLAPAWALGALATWTLARAVGAQGAKAAWWVHGVAVLVLVAGVLAARAAGSARRQRADDAELVALQDAHESKCDALRPSAALKPTCEGKAGSLLRVDGMFDEADREQLINESSCGSTNFNTYFALLVIDGTPLSDEEHWLEATSSYLDALAGCVEDPSQLRLLRAALERERHLGTLDKDGEAYSQVTVDESRDGGFKVITLQRMVDL